MKFISSIAMLIVTLDCLTDAISGASSIGPPVWALWVIAVAWAIQTVYFIAFCDVEES